MTPSASEGGVPRPSSTATFGRSGPAQGRVNQTLMEKRQNGGRAAGGASRSLVDSVWRARCSRTATTPAPTDAVMPCSKCCPGADPPGRSVTMACRDASESASPAQVRQGPSRKSETETLRYACCTRSSRAHRSSLLTRQPAHFGAQPHPLFRTLSGIPARPACSPGASLAL